MQAWITMEYAAESEQNMMDIYPQCQKKGYQLNLRDII